MKRRHLTRLAAIEALLKARNDGARASTWLVIGSEAEGFDVATDPVLTVENHQLQELEVLRRRDPEAGDLQISLYLLGCAREV